MDTDTINQLNQDKKKSKSNPVMGIVFLVLVPVLFLLMGGGDISSMGAAICLGCIFASVGSFTGKFRLW